MRIIDIKVNTVLRALMKYAKTAQRRAWMVSQKQLIELVADTIGASIETVTVIDRYLAEAGYRTRALRGRGSTSMTYQDAANMII
ncbi:hypothetical protein, partial [Pseudomonas kitaguniensis]|uniref:hypothetical protein n=1 Tax=Pseudomonas kitaguniensis TaxID=2607908 RepID=UPI003D04C191